MWSAFRDAKMQRTMQASYDGGIPLRPGSAMEKRRAGRGTPVLRLMLNLREPKPDESSPTVPIVAVWYQYCRSGMRQRQRRDVVDDDDGQARCRRRKRKQALGRKLEEGSSSGTEIHPNSTRAVFTVCGRVLSSRLQPIQQKSKRKRGPGKLSRCSPTPLLILGHTNGSRRRPHFMRV